MGDQAGTRALRARAQAIGGGVREATAAGVVRRVFAVQAQDATAAALGVLARGRDLDAEAVRAAYEDERAVVRGWFMRGTLHTVPSEDAGWLLRLLGPRVLAGTGHRYRDLGLDADLRERADRLLRDAVASEGPLGRAALTERLTALGVAPEGQAPFHLIRHAALNGLLCHGPWRDGEATFVLSQDWLPGPPDAYAPEGDDALAELARRYLRAYAPAEADDFAAWSGLPVTWARRAWKALDAAGALAAREAREPDAASAAPDVRLLPAYDNYLLGYRGRDLAVPAEHGRRVWPGGGVIRPTVTVDGLVVGTWRRAGRHGVEVEAFGPLSAAVREGIDAEAAAVSRFLRPAGRA
ncbi:winged helix DNA-binding domain-containing protein [Streptomyces avicenniae]|uniref:winged helix DNA-binding domain-containing protein n=1 Tax=Streptomyces avicenniae TaxID=500153 RepID=UPI00069B71B1|nr:winged helix DNA-binding domain-containing protein [Streptomyces avicenniae]